MLQAEILEAALGYERQLYRHLTELADLTAELEKAVDRQDNVTIRMFLKLRQEQLSQAAERRRSFRIACRAYSEEERLRLLELLGETPPAPEPEEEPLVQQTARNRKLLSQVIAADRRVSLRVVREKSYYRGKDQ